jgi:hypothetical protein
MPLITDEYRELNKELHRTNEFYGMSGKRHTQAIVNMAAGIGSQDVLDYGCGKSTLAKNLPFAIKQYDPAVTKYAELPEPADIVVCTDVLEHIEPECLDDVLTDLARLAKKGVYLTAATKPAQKKLSDGRNAHLIVEPGQWWLEKLMKYFTIRIFQKMEDECLIIGEPAANSIE